MMTTTAPDLSEKLILEAERPQQVIEEEQYSRYDSFESYMRSINFTKLLTRDEESYLGQIIQKNSRAIKKLIFSTPYAGQRVVEMMEDGSFGNGHQIGKVKYARADIINFTNQIKQGYALSDDESINRGKRKLYKSLRKINLKVELAEKIANEMKEKLINLDSTTIRTLMMESKIETDERIKLLSQYSMEYYGAVNKLVTRNLKLVVSIANKYRTTGLDIIDLLEIGNDGLISAAKDFKPGKGFKFSTFAGNCITNEFNTKLAKRPYDLTILDVCYGADRNSQETYKDRISDDSTILPIENMATNEIASLIRKILDEKLKDKERTVINLLFGIDNAFPKTPTEISKLMGISRQRVSVIRDEALVKLKTPAIDAGLEGYFK